MKKKLTLKAEVERTIKLLIITLAVLIIVLSGAFLFQTSITAQKGYLLEQVRKMNDELKNVSEDLKTNVTEASSSKSFENNNKLKDMEAPKPENSNYLLPKDND